MLLTEKQVAEQHLYAPIYINVHFCVYTQNMLPMEQCLEVCLNSGYLHWVDLEISFLVDNPHWEPKLVLKCIYPFQ